MNSWRRDFPKRRKSSSPCQNGGLYYTHRTNILQNNTDTVEDLASTSIRSSTFEADLTKDASDYPEAMERAIEMKREDGQSLSDAAEQSKSLMADVPRAFKMVAKKRDARKSKLKLLLDKKAEMTIT